MLMKNEVFWLDKLNYLDFVPNLVSVDGESIVMTYVGRQVTPKSLPNDWREQVYSILNELAGVPCFHNDIKVEEILVMEGKIHLVDFHHATASREEFVALKRSGKSGCSNSIDDYCAFINILGNMERVKCQ